MKHELDPGGHEALTRAILAKTSGNACGSARERLCDFVDDTLAPFDRSLVDGHLAHCAACAALAAVLAESAAVLPSFATLAPPTSVVIDVLRATSRRPSEPGLAERLSAWLGRMAARPRFSLEVAYVLTVLLLLVLGNPVAAFKDASVRVEPRVAAVATAVSRPIAKARAAGEETLTSVGRAIRPKAEAVGTLAQGRLMLWQFWQTYVDAPARAALLQLHEWANGAIRELKSIVGAMTGEPSAGAVR
jgi:anti-sigma factor RsiW